jgi:hypothetical protein
MKIYHLETLSTNDEKLNGGNCPFQDGCKNGELPRLGDCR